MTRPFEPRDFATTSDFLRFSLDEIEEDQWKDCEAARLRSAASRSYYAVFLSLKARIQDARIGFRFPTTDVHLKLQIALSSKLGGSHTLILLLRSLLRTRKAADYENSHTLSLSTAESMVNNAFEALDQVEALTTAELRAIADELVDFENGNTKYR